VGTTYDLISSSLRGEEQLEVPIHKLICIQNLAEKLGHAQKEIVLAKMFAIPAGAIKQRGRMGVS
jgi:hypothetical protein